MTQTMTQHTVLPTCPAGEDLLFEPDERGFGVLRTEQGALPLVGMRVRAEIVGSACTTRVIQTFANEYDEPIEATYIFPLPARAAVTDSRVDFSKSAAPLTVATSCGMRS